MGNSLYVSIITWLLYIIAAASVGGVAFLVIYGIMKSVSKIFGG